MVHAELQALGPIRVSSVLLLALSEAADGGLVLDAWLCSVTCSYFQSIEIMLYYN